MTEGSRVIPLQAKHGYRLQSLRESKGHTEVAFAFAGTNSVLDALDDFLQLFGVSPQYHKGVNIARDFVKINGGAEYY